MNDPHFAPGSKLMHFLDNYRVGEDLAGDVFATWAAQTTSVALRGRLRVLAGREKSHARLLEARLRELGGEPHAVVTDAAYLEACRVVQDPGQSDRVKWEAWMRIVPPDTSYLRSKAARFSEDPETQALLLEIIADEDTTTQALIDAGRRLE